LNQAIIENSLFKGTVTRAINRQTIFAYKVMTLYLRSTYNIYVYFVPGMPYSLFVVKIRIVIDRM